LEQALGWWLEAKRAWNVYRILLVVGNPPLSHSGFTEYPYFNAYAGRGYQVIY
jgi:hypothetical protein